MSGETTAASRAWHALATVRDPELDEPITDLGFVLAATARDGGVSVLLRLPTYFCAPNFAYIMVADAYDALCALGEFDWVQVRLTDHFAADEINAGVAAGSGFAGTFDGEAVEELDELRQVFRRKAHLACLERACRTLLEDGWQIDALADSTLGDLPESAERDSLLRRRADVGLPTSADSPLLVEDDGTAVADGNLAARLRFAKTVRVSIDGNAGFCLGLLRTRYGAAVGTGEAG